MTAESREADRWNRWPAWALRAGSRHPPTPAKQVLEVGVAGAQHGVETRYFELPAAAFAGFLVMAVVAHLLENSFAIDFFLEAPEGFLYGLAFFQFNLGHAASLPFPTSGRAAGWCYPTFGQPLPVKTDWHATRPDRCLSI